MQATASRDEITLDERFEVAMKRLSEIVNELRAAKELKELTPKQLAALVMAKALDDQKAGRLHAVDIASLGHVLAPALSGRTPATMAKGGPSPRRLAGGDILTELHGRLQAHRATCFAQLGLRAEDWPIGA